MHWKINEIASLYDISAHTLRYYEEINLVVPSRGNNNYRIYTDEHLQQLNIIRDLRKLNIPLEHIKDYLDNRTVPKTLHLLNKQKEYMEKELMNLQEKQNRILERIDTLTHSDELIEGKCKVITYPDRFVIASSDKDIESENVDISLKELYKKYQNKLPYLDQCMFGSFMYLKPMNGLYNIQHQVFYYLDNKLSPDIMLIPKGSYATICYKGSYEKTQHYLAQLKAFIVQHNFKTASEFFETYLIDFHETNIEEEYVTRIEVKIQDRK